MTNAAGNTAISAFAYTVDASDRRTRVDLVDGGRWKYSYDNAGQLTGGNRYGPKLDQQEGTLVQYAYQYDAMGNPTSRTEDAGVSAYTFNNLNQLVTGSWSDTLSTFGWTQTANLAGINVTANQQTEPAMVFQKGEWTAKGLTVPAGDTTLTVTRTAQDQTTTQAQTTVARPADATAYSHDLNGNLLGDGTWAYTWDEENRLASAETSANVGGGTRRRLTFAYDAIGRRRSLREYAWQDNAWLLTLERCYTWDGWLPVHEETTDYSTAPATTHVDTYIRGLDLSGSLEGAGGIGGMLALVHDGTVVCYFDNGRGDITELADPATGEPVAHYEYDPFGRQLISSGPLAESNRYRFSSKEQDATGLSYYGYRYYHPVQARWVSRDPIGEVGGFCAFAFVGNQATLRTDALGLSPSPPPWVGTTPNQAITPCSWVGADVDPTIPRDLRAQCIGKSTHILASGTPCSGEPATCVKRVPRPWTCTAQILIKPGVEPADPTASSRSVWQHESEHGMNWGRLWQEVARVESAAWATNCMHYLCDAKRFFLLGAYIDYHVGELDYADAELDCTDYYPGPRKTKRCLDRDNAQANRLHLAQQVIKAADDLLHCLSRKKCACRSGQ